MVDNVNFLVLLIK